MLRLYAYPEEAFKMAGKCHDIHQFLIMLYQKGKFNLTYSAAPNLAFEGGVNKRRSGVTTLSHPA